MPVITYEVEHDEDVSVGAGDIINGGRLIAVALEGALTRTCKRHRDGIQSCGCKIPTAGFEYCPGCGGLIEEEE